MLIARGARPSVNDIATAADVSRRTVYLYFPHTRALVSATLQSAAEAHEVVVKERTGGQ